MKAEVKNREIVYPCLRCHDAFDFYVVLFSEEGTGMVVHSEDVDRPIGYYSTNFYMPNFKGFHANLVLSNN